MPWIFGFFIALASIAENAFLAAHADLFQQEDIPAPFAFGENDPVSFWLTAAFLLFLFRTFGKSNLIATLAPLSQKEASADPLKIPALRSLRDNFFRALLLETVVFFFLIGIVLLLAAPAAFAFRYNEAALDTLVFLGFLVFLPIAAGIFFTREFAFFYLIISRLRLRSSFENGSALFFRHMYRSLAFGIFSLALTLAFTFCLNLVMLSIVALSQKTGLPFLETTLWFSASLVIIGWWNVIRQTLWLLFFRDLAAPKDKEGTEKKSLLARDNLPETPPA